MKAILIIDMQQGSFTSATPRYDVDGVVERINTLSAHFRQTGDKVVFIQHDGRKENEFLPGTTAWKILPGLMNEPEDVFIDKTANDCFYQSDLGRVLKNLEVNELIITGCATDFCVDSTIRSALAKDFNITVIADGHTTANRPQLTAEQVIAHHNWLWANMIPTKGKIEVISFDNYLGRL